MQAQEMTGASPVQMFSSLMLTIQPHVLIAAWGVLCDRFAISKQDHLHSHDRLLNNPVGHEFTSWSCHDKLHHFWH